ncbi:MAG: hypothetical protein U5K75_11320 [Ahrensia sp.]|nr:hypothetical protein [Ahrensia sp.]
MFALKANLLGTGRNGSINQSRLLDHGLLRQLRRPVRLFNRLLEGTVSIPRYLSASVNCAVIGGAILYGTIVGGQLTQSVDVVASNLGFAVQEIEISGNTHTPSWRCL